METNGCIYGKQINLHHCKAATALVARHFSEMQTKNPKQKLIVLVQEPYIVNNIVTGFDKNVCDVHYDISKTQKRRTCIVTSKNVKIALMPQFCSGDLTTVLLNSGKVGRGEEIIFSSVYLPDPEGVPMTTIPDTLTQDAIDFSSKRGTPIIMGGDVNAHHTVWGSTNINARGEKLLEYIATTDLVIMNRGIEPTFITKTRKEVLDITLASCSIQSKIKRWHVSPEDSLSDHREINFIVDFSAVSDALYRNPRNTDWNLFISLVRKSMSKFTNNGNLDSQAKLDRATLELSNILLHAFHRACPGRVPTQKKNCWWNNKLKRMKKEVRRLRRIYDASNNEMSRTENWRNYSRTKDMYKKEIFDAKHARWVSFCEEIANEGATAKLHRLLATDPANKPGMLKLNDGTYTNTLTETATYLLETHFPGCEIVTGDHNNRTQLFNVITENIDEVFLETIINSETTKWALCSFKPYKSPGYDNIFPIMIQKAWDNIGTTVLKIYKGSITLGYIPEIWRKVKVTFIPKPGKSDYNSPKSFRPISLSSVLLKGLERLIDTFIKDFLQHNESLQTNQHAYQVGKSTETALHELVNLIEKTLQEKEYAVGTFMDISGAFDNISFLTIKKELEERRINKHIKAWICNMLENRQITYDLHGTNVTVAAKRGTPQGGVLSPTLWIIVMDSLLKRLKAANINAIGYADDLVILCRGKFLGTLSEQTNKGLKIAERWCTETGLSVNPEKTEQTIFTNKRDLTAFRDTKIFGKVIKRSQNVKYLGLVLNSKLNWMTHIREKIEKCRRIFWCCKKAIGRNWGLKPKYILWLYTAIIRPILLYGSFLWWKHTEISNTKRELSKFQRLISLSISGAIHTTPQQALEALLMIPSLDVFIKGEALKASFRIIKMWNARSNNIENGHSSAWKELVTINGILGSKIDYKTTHFNLSTRIKITIPTSEEWGDDYRFVTPTTHDIWFTDGSVGINGGGYGIYNLNREHIESGYTGKYATVLQTELVAILNCCTTIIKKQWYEKPIRIFTDSKTALKLLSDIAMSSALAIECVEAMGTIIRSGTLELFWVPSHHGIHGNERADALAKIGANTKGIMGPEPIIPLDTKIIKSVIKQWITNESKRRWTLTDSCETTKSFLPVMEERIAKEIINMKKSDIGVLIRVITGHCKLNYFLSLTNQGHGDPICELCGRETETSIHYMCNCMTLATLRKSIYGQNIIRPTDVLAHELKKSLEFIKKSERNP